MATASLVRSDESRLSRLDRALDRLERALNFASGVVILALVLLAVIHVLSRKFLNAPVPGYVDWTETFMAVFAFLGIAHVQREGGHIRMDVVVGRLRGRVAWAAELIGVVLMLLITTVLIYGSWYHFLRSFDPSMPLWSRDSTIDIGLPIWPAKLVVPVSLSVLWLRLVLQIWGYARALRTGEARPVAVPLVPDPAEAAMAEAEAVIHADGPEDAEGGR
ncbi:MAG: TRAP transporter small permease [Alphaproteobacteria bacterium]|nr:MAG: TRAP transporter small permease [Alphaproteobacteria bacterium]